MIKEERITGRLDDGTVFIHSETGEEGVGALTTKRRLPEICCKLARLEDKIENGDLIEVVMCKDCKHGQWDNYYGQRRGVICEYNQDKIMPFNHFCANGERIGDSEHAEQIQNTV